MWTETDEGKQVIGEISKDIVRQIAPEEMEVYDELLIDYFENPDPPIASDDRLGFGGSALVAYTPVIAAVMGAVVKFLIEEVAKGLKQESSTLIAQKIKTLFHRTDGASDDSLNLSRAQLDKVLSIVRSEASRRGMKPE